ncbi:MAG: hypothetical protein II349_00965 [Akkermansia sp.]|nr:hypothetical protein [Akkermansia sp.]
MDDKLASLRDYLLQCYAPEEWPTLLNQAEEWALTRPLEGLRVLDATPLFRNTLAKFLALMSAGAKVYVPWRSSLPADAEVVAQLADFGIVHATREDKDFDIVLDCAGDNCRLRPKLGSCELTRTGVQRYERAPFPVFMADAGRIKHIETMLGTGESLFRALRHLGYGDVAGRSLVVVGYGKVGRGVVYYACQLGMRVTVADVEDKSGVLPPGVDFVHVDDAAAMAAATLNAWCVVSVTGRMGALRRRLPLAQLLPSGVLLASLGVEDEFGPEVPEQRVLNHKRPLNFMLQEPTSMRFIETTMALHNACALELLTADLPHGYILPPPDVEERLLRVACERGLIGSDIELAKADAAM